MTQPPFHDDPTRDPVRTSQIAARPVLPKRFYAEATVAAEADGTFSIRLDGRGAKTTARHPLALPTRAAAEAVAAEWQAQGEFITPATMPLTRLAGAALDAVMPDPQPIADEIVRYGGSDLLCYRADAPDSLTARQAELWDPPLAWMDERFGAPFVLAQGVMHVAQPPRTLEAVAEAVAAVPPPFALAALHVMTTLSGSVVLALAVAHGRLTAAQAWAAAHVDEDHQIERWGTDDEAAARRAKRLADFEAAARFHADVTSGA